MARRNGSSTLSEAVLKNLKTDILSGRYEPGAPLTVSELAQKFNVSIAVVREALTQLTSHGLVIKTPNYGFTVKTVSEVELDNLIETRLINESAALRLSIANGDLTWEANVIAAHHKLAQTPEYTDFNQKSVISEEWSEAHGQFHYSLISACNNPILLDMCKRLWDLSQLYRHWSIPQMPDRDFHTEHKLLLSTVLERDSDRAVELFKEHIQLTADILLNNNDSKA
ncbi:GntR family transcriptional regulator [Bacillus sp. FJAT-27264]|uniref:GntR family transcriptional regulator n=1 Tax=Paenibacillus sp. (strain DSM 101736 / FJAT-27264) TaxID=1850362 RepID=UPI0008080DC5|nr:GntR family transcriptional regulator [Bacillus sp. FJAT-27264]OBZ16273.1 GntR family transcriptional regulator [Bacillus sp. FJAT-27264]